MSSTTSPGSQVPVRFGTIADAGPGSALLIEGEAAVACDRPVERFFVSAIFARHPAGCPCCAPRTDVARALSRLFLARARGEVGFFHEVVVVVASARAEATIRAALVADPLLSAWFRLAPAPRMGDPRRTGEDHGP